MVLYEATLHDAPILALNRHGRWYISTDMGPADPWRVAPSANLDASFRMGAHKNMQGMTTDEMEADGVKLGHLVWHDTR